MWCCCCSSSVWRRSGSFTVGKGTCVSTLWPRVRRSSSCSPVQRSPFTTCCCRPLSCGWSSSSTPSFSASTASSSCLDSSLCLPSPEGPKCTEDFT